MNRPKKDKGLVLLFNKATFPAWKVWRGISSRGRVMPNFIIIGAQKGGTTSLFEYLIQHPDLIPPLKKEVKFFDLNYQNGLDWYRAHFPFAYRLKEGQITGESSPNMLFHPLAPEQTARHLPNVRLIVLLRDPGQRAYSHYQMNLRSGRDTGSFQEAINREPQRLAGTREAILAGSASSQTIRNFINFSYLAKGEYLDQLKRWETVFSREQILVLQSEHLFKEPAQTLAEVFKFLHLAPWEPSSYPVHNPGGYYSAVLPETQGFLIDHFRPHNERLFEHLGTKFSWQE
jgi:hypothetical protein